jgi:putative phosphoribosyl transferase
MTTVQVGPMRLAGDLTVPMNARALILFAHGSGSSRMSSRNRAVARQLNKRGLATLLMDLLTEEEERRSTSLRFDIPLLASRLDGALTWLRSEKPLSHLPVGVFGASTGAAAALVTCAGHNAASIFAMVSRGGRVDLAAGGLRGVRVPVLLIVGSEDATVLELNEEMLEYLPETSKLEVIAGASHLFEERGALEDVARLAGDWFLNQLPQSAVQLGGTLEGPAIGLARGPHLREFHPR